MKLTEAEWLIMNVLWDKYPAKAREVAERLPDRVSWAYTTIKTMLTRLVEKKAVSEAKKGNTSFYEPILLRHQARQTALRTLLTQAFDGAFGPLMHFLVEDQNLTARQRKELIKILAKSRKAKGARK
ncbi:MAG: BlaI/MecI/CopY family transcriptional regulator [Planctomycetota bacterium]|jgi:BlaI family penicillinase repressor